MIPQPTKSYLSTLLIHRTILVFGYDTFFGHLSNHSKRITSGTSYPYQNELKPVVLNCRLQRLYRLSYANSAIVKARLSSNIQYQ